jgi:predicted ATPase
MNNYFVLTGAPGAGKTTVLNILQQAGHQCKHEVARAIIREQQITGGDALPWHNKTDYLQLMIDRTIECYQQAVKENLSLCFFDRGLPDAIAYAHLIGFNLSAELDTLANSCRYNQRVFVFPPWEDIYRTDEERKQNWDEVLQSYDAMSQMYERYGYRLIEVPAGTPEARADFILQEAAA